MTFIHDLLRDIDTRWEPPGPGMITLKLLGSAALFLQTSYQRGTKDSDVLQTDQVTGAVRDQLVTLAGPGSELHRRHRVYVDVVPRSIPFLPYEPLWHPLDIELENFEVQVLDATDVVASKLKRFNGNDRDDIRAMIERGHVEHHRLLARIEELVGRYQFDSRCDSLPVMVDRFHQLERDWFGVAESPVHLPESIFR